MNPIRLSKSERASLERQLRNAHNARLYRRTLVVLEYHEGRAIAEIVNDIGSDPFLTGSPSTAEEWI